MVEETRQTGGFYGCDIRNYNKMVLDSDLYYTNQPMSAQVSTTYVYINKYSHIVQNKLQGNIRFK